MARRKIQIVKAGRGRRQLTIDDERMGGRFGGRIEALDVVKQLETVGQLSPAEVIEATRRIGKTFRHMPDVVPEGQKMSFQPTPKQPRRKKRPMLQPWHASSARPQRPPPRQNWQGVAIEYRRSNSMSA